MLILSSTVSKDEMGNKGTVETDSREERVSSRVGSESRELEEIICNIKDEKVLQIHRWTLSVISMTGDLWTQRMADR